MKKTSKYKKIIFIGWHKLPLLSAHRLKFFAKKFSNIFDKNCKKIAIIENKKCLKTPHFNVYKSKFAIFNEYEDELTCEPKTKYVICDAKDNILYISPQKCNCDEKINSNEFINPSSNPNKCLEESYIPEFNKLVKFYSEHDDEIDKIY